MVQETLSEMEAFSPVGSNILNKSGVKNNNNKQDKFANSTIVFQLIEVEPAMMYDSVHVFARGLEAATAEGPELRIRFDSVDSAGGYNFQTFSTEISPVRTSYHGKKVQPCIITCLEFLSEVLQDPSSNYTSVWSPRNLKLKTSQI